MSPFDLGPYWARCVSRKRVRLVVADLALEEDSSEEEPTVFQVPVTLGYHSCDTDDLNNGFIRYRERNLSERQVPGGLRLEAILTIQAYKVDFSSCVSGRRYCDVERRDSDRSKENRQRKQLEGPRAELSAPWGRLRFLITGKTPRGKRKRLHMPMPDVNRRTEAVTAAFKP